MSVTETLKTGTTSPGDQLFQELDDCIHSRKGSRSLIEIRSEIHSFKEKGLITDYCFESLERVVGVVEKVQRI